MLKWKDRAVVVLTSVVSIALMVSQVAAELAEMLAGWDGDWANFLGIAVAAIFAIRRVTQVSPGERGLLPQD